MKEQYTPGPWALDEKDWGNVLCPQRGLEGEFPRVAGRVAHVGFKPNAQLIAAAPELLAALKEWLEVGNDLKGRRAVREKACAAVAKAEGQSQ